jgi:predicted ATPase
VHKLASNAALTAEIVAKIVERTDGVLLFVEELTKAVLESAGQSDQVAAVLGSASLRLRRGLASHEHRWEERR